MKKEMVRISILQSSKIVTLLYVALGLIYTPIGIGMVVFGGPGMKLLGVLYLLMPLIMALIGFVGFVISAGLYNLFAKWVGGFEFELEDKDVEYSTAAGGVGRPGVQPTGL